MPRTKEQFAEMRDASNRRIRSAASRLFAEKGFAAVNIDDIAEAAELSKGMVYRHYESKEALFASLIQGAMDGLRRITETMEQGGDPAAILEGIAREIYADLNSSEDFMNLLMLVTQGVMGGATNGTAVIDTNIQTIEAAAALIRQGQEAGVFADGDPTQMGTYFFACIQGLGIMKRALGERFQMPDVGILTAFLYRGLQK